MWNLGKPQVFSAGSSPLRCWVSRIPATKLLGGHCRSGRGAYGFAIAKQLRISPILRHSGE